MKKNKIAWITDSVASLSKEFIEENNVFVVPLNIIFGDESFREDIDITAEDFYARLKESKTLPKTSQPAVGEFVELYEKIKKEYKKAIIIHLTSSLSGTYQTSRTALDMADFKAELIDSKIGSYPFGMMVKKGIELEKEGKKYDEIVTYLRGMPDKAKLILAPGSLEQLHKGGRLSGTQAIIGGLLQVKLVLEFQEGKIELVEKIRTEKKVKKKMFSMVDEVIQKNLVNEVCVLHANELKKALEWKNELKEMYPEINFVTLGLSPVPGTHAGQGTMGFAWNEK